MTSEKLTLILELPNEVEDSLDLLAEVATKISSIKGICGMIEYKALNTAISFKDGGVIFAEMDNNEDI